MATKAEKLAELAARAWNGWFKQVASEVQTGEDGKTITIYTYSYSEKKNGTVTTKGKFNLSVYDEGGAGEEAEWSSPPKRKDTALEGMRNHLEAQAEYVDILTIEVNEETLRGYATVAKDNGTSYSVVTVLAWKDPGQPIQHRELVT